MAKAKRERRTSIRNIGAGDDALAALERLEQLEQEEAARAKAAAETGETAPAEDDKD